jgi:hypothetical protein
MMTASNLFLAIAVASALYGVASAVMIAIALKKRGVAISWVWLRVLIVSRYLNQYRDVTRKETGRTGPLFYSYVVAMNLALVSAIVGFLFRAI